MNIERTACLGSLHDPFHPCESGGTGLDGQEALDETKRVCIDGVRSDFVFGEKAELCKALWMFNNLRGEDMLL